MKRQAKDRHHRKPTSMGGQNTEKNISIVPVHMHRAYHMLFSNLPPKEVAKVLTSVWIDPAYYLVAIPRAKARKGTPKQPKGKFLQITFQIERKRKL